ncbi:GNAT family N-acetyltransferase [Paludibacterium paludis]|uniref:GNAT family N-acetyltransferase n=1 Tax=Paludibacterium paludis TaxID=1225769 RepID=UPI0035711866
MHSFTADVPACQIGYVGNNRMTGQGLFTSAAASLALLAFWLGLRRLEAWCDSRNTASIRFTLRLGFVEEGVLRDCARDGNANCATRRWPATRVRIGRHPTLRTASRKNESPEKTRPATARYPTG